jgi:hypothetical protein
MSAGEERFKLATKRGCDVGHSRFGRERPFDPNTALGTRTLRWSLWIDRTLLNSTAIGICEMRNWDPRKELM